MVHFDFIRNFSKFHIYVVKISRTNLRTRLVLTKNLLNKSLCSKTLRRRYLKRKCYISVKIMDNRITLPRIEVMTQLSCQFTHCISVHSSLFTGTLTFICGSLIVVSSKTKCCNVRFIINVSSLLFW